MRVKLFAYCYMRQLNMSQMARMIRITSVPTGEAPVWVREKWVGLELPTMGLAQARIYCTGRDSYRPNLPSWSVGGFTAWVQ